MSSIKFADILCWGKKNCKKLGEKVLYKYNYWLIENNNLIIIMWQLQNIINVRNKKKHNIDTKN